MCCSRSGKAVRLTYEHKGADEAEAKRIVKAGGFIVLNRVNGTTPPLHPRAILWFRACYREHAQPIPGSLLASMTSYPTFVFFLTTTIIFARVSNLLRACTQVFSP